LDQKSSSREAKTRGRKAKEKIIQQNDQGKINEDVM